MKISKSRLKRIIAEECGDLGIAPAPAAAAPLDAVKPVTALAESASPEAELVMEMEQALDGLQQVVESVSSAASLCTDCVQEVAAQAPLLEAAATQAVALQEMLEAQVAVMAESVEGRADHVADAAAEVAAEVQAEARRRRARRRIAEAKKRKAARKPSSRRVTRRRR